jgi:hypothetical protein
MDSAMAHVNAAFCPHTLAGGKGQLLQLPIKLNEVNQSQKPVISSIMMLVRGLFHILWFSLVALKVFCRLMRRRLSRG